MRHATILFLGLALLVWAPAADAQVPNAGLAMQIVQARKANAALMHNYQWNCRTELIDNGETQDTLIQLVEYGPDGQLQRSLLNDQSAPLPHGFLRHAIAEGQRQKVEQYVTGLRDLLDRYTLPTAGKVLDFMSSAGVEFTAGPDGRQLLHASGSDVVVPGDTLSIWADASTHQIAKLQITTTYQGSTANLTASFKRLAAGGLNHVSMAEVDVPEKKMTLLVHNYDYEQND